MHFRFPGTGPCFLVESCSESLTVAFRCSVPRQGPRSSVPRKAQRRQDEQLPAPVCSTRHPPTPSPRDGAAPSLHQAGGCQNSQGRSQAIYSMLLPYGKVMNFLTLVRHRARSAGFRRSWPGTFAALRVGSISNPQPRTPSKLNGGGKEIKTLLDFSASALNKKKRQETSSSSPQFRNQTVHTSRHSRSRDHEVGGGTQAQQTHGKAGGGLHPPAAVNQTRTPSDSLGQAKHLFQAQRHRFPREVCTEQ